MRAPGRPRSRRTRRGPRPPPTRRRTGRTPRGCPALRASRKPPASPARDRVPAAAPRRRCPRSSPSGRSSGWRSRRPPRRAPSARVSPLSESSRARGSRSTRSGPATRGRAAATAAPSGLRRASVPVSHQTFALSLLSSTGDRARKLEQRPRPREYAAGGKAEFLEYLGTRSGGAETVKAKYLALGPDPLPPAHAGPGLNRHARARGSRQHLLAIGLGLGFEQLHAGHREDPH